MNNVGLILDFTGASKFGFSDIFLMQISSYIKSYPRKHLYMADFEGNWTSLCDMDDNIIFSQTTMHGYGCDSIGRFNVPACCSMKFLITPPLIFKLHFLTIRSSCTENVEIVNMHSHNSIHMLHNCLLWAPENLGDIEFPK